MKTSTLFVLFAAASFVTASDVNPPPSDKTVLCSPINSIRTGKPSMKKVKVKTDTPATAIVSSTGAQKETVVPCSAWTDPEKLEDDWEIDPTSPGAKFFSSLWFVDASLGFLADQRLVEMNPDNPRWEHYKSLVNTFSARRQYYFKKTVKMINEKYQVLVKIAPTASQDALLRLVIDANKYNKVMNYIDKRLFKNPDSGEIAEILLEKSSPALQNIYTDNTLMLEKNPTYLIELSKGFKMFFYKAKLVSKFNEAQIKAILDQEDFDSMRAIVESLDFEKLKSYLKDFNIAVSNEISVDTNTPSKDRNVNSAGDKKHKSKTSLPTHKPKLTKRVNQGTNENDNTTIYSQSNTTTNEDPEQSQNESNLTENGEEKEEEEEVNSTETDSEGRGFGFWAVTMAAVVVVCAAGGYFGITFLRSKNFQ